MNKNYDMLGLFSVESENTVVDKESLKAQKRWEKDGTVTEKYMEHTLGDISKGVLAIAPHTFAPSVEKEKKTHKRKPRSS